MKKAMVAVPPPIGDDNLLPMGSNKLGSKEIFKEKTLYDEHAYPPMGPRPLDTFSRFDLLYGRVDERLNPVYPVEDELKQLPMGQGKETIFALNFVADAFKDMQDYFNKAAAMGRIQQGENSPAFTSIEPALGLTSEENIHRTYAAHINKAYDIFVGEFLDSQLEQKIGNFDDFVQIFLAYITRVCYSTPFTRVAFCSSGYANPRQSGLVIDLYKGKHDDDYAKYAGFIRDNNFSFFARTCERFGFMVDKNAPWRIYANIDSPYMKEKMEDNGMFDRGMFFSTYYIKALDYELDNLKTLFFQLYDLYLSQYPDVTVLTTKKNINAIAVRDNLGGYSTKITYEPRKKITWEEYEKKYPTDYWIRLLIYIRAVETRKPYTQKRFDKSVRLACEYYHYTGLATALEYIQKAYGHTTEEIVEKKSQNNLTEEEACDILKTRKNKLEYYRPSFYF